MSSKRAWQGFSLVRLLFSQPLSVLQHTGLLWLRGCTLQTLIVHYLLHCLPQFPQAQPACSTYMFPGRVVALSLPCSPQGTESSRLSACLSLYSPSERRAIGSPLLLQSASLLLQGQCQPGIKHIHRVCSSLRVRAESPKDLNL